MRTTIVWQTADPFPDSLRLYLESRRGAIRGAADARRGGPLTSREAYPDGAPYDLRILGARRRGYRQGRARILVTGPAQGPIGPRTLDAIAAGCYAGRDLDAGAGPAPDPDPDPDRAAFLAGVRAWAAGAARVAAGLETRTRDAVRR